MTTRHQATARAAVLGLVALALAACAQLVGADFDGEHGGLGASLGDGATELPDGTVLLPDGAIAPGDDGATGHDAAFTPDGGIPIDDDGGTQFVDASCGAGQTTSITGFVYDPAGKTPLYDVLVYVPSTGLDAIPTQLWCDRCGAAPSGAPFATALSHADGSFTLNGVPAGTNIPIVVQIGKWRRIAHIPTVAPCTSNDLIDPNLTRLPKNSKTDDGTMPRIAIASGQGDAVECVLLKMGIDASEFTSPGGGGHVVIYTENGGYVTTSTEPDGGTQGPELYSTLGALEQFDQVLFGCEAQQETKAPSFAANLAAYADEGGRVWFEHFEFPWLQAMPAAYSSQITFLSNEPSPNVDMTIDKGFPKGSALSTWMGALSQAVDGGFTAADTRADIQSTIARTWMTTTYGIVDDAGTTINTTTPEQVSFNTPTTLGPSFQCGRVIYSDFHTGELSAALALQFPGECSTTALTNEGLAMEFSLLDLGACILPDNQTPVAP